MSQIRNMNIGVYLAIRTPDLECRCLIKYETVTGTVGMAAFGETIAYRHSSKMRKWDGV